MPYKIIGRKVYHFKHGRWSLKQTARSHENAVKTVRLLHGIDAGWHPMSRHMKKYYR